MINSWFQPALGIRSLSLFIFGSISIILIAFSAASILISFWGLEILWIKFWSYSIRLFIVRVGLELDGVVEALFLMIFENKALLFFMKSSAAKLNLLVCINSTKSALLFFQSCMHKNSKDSNSINSVFEYFFIIWIITLKMFWVDSLIALDFIL